MLDVDAWRREVVERVSSGARLAGMYASADDDGCLVAAIVAERDRLSAVHALIRPGADGELTYPALTTAIPAAFWYERSAHDLSGVVPVGHPRLDPLLLPVATGSARPLPGNSAESIGVTTASPPGPADVAGRGMFTLTYGPVRSGVVESIEFLIESPGEDIPHLNIRPHFKHRGIAKRFEGRSPRDGVLLAENVEGIASVAHALAFSHAVEAIAATEVPLRAKYLRVVYAELERIANHLDVAMRLADAAGLAVATSRFAWHKESVMRLTSYMCGSRFGRSVVVPGGVAAEPMLSRRDIIDELSAIHRRISADAKLAMNTPSFLDRLRGTGVLSESAARSWAVLGPLARASGVDDDGRLHRPTDAYAALAARLSRVVDPTGDVMARMNVRWREIDDSVSLIDLALTEAEPLSGPLSTEMRYPTGESFALGWAEAPQGETLHAVTLRDGRLTRCFARSASFQNLVAFHDVWHGDVFTDFAFIEASFGLGYAGVAM